MTALWLQDPAQEDYLTVLREQEQRGLSIYQQFATPHNAANLTQFSTFFPQASSELGLALTIGGIPSSDPMVGQLVQQEMQVRPTMGPVSKSGGGWWDPIGNALSEFVADPLVGATRWTMSGFQALWDLTGGGAPIRALQQSRTEGIPFGDAWAQQEPELFTALGGIISDPVGTVTSTMRESFTPDEQQMAMHERGTLKFTSNLGSGFFAGGTVAPDVETAVQQGMLELEQRTANLPTQQQYTARLKGSADVWRNAIARSSAQQSIGARPGQFARAQAESVMFTNQLGRTTPWSPGRIAAAYVFEPGTDAFKYASGFGDFTAQVFLDPINYLGLWWAKAGVKGRLLWGVADQTEAAMQGVRKIPLNLLTPNQLRKRAGLQLALPAGSERNLLSTPITPQGQAAILGDPTRELMGQLKLPVGEMPAAGIPPSSVATPWYLDEAESATRVTNAFDPPQWYIDAARRAKQRTADTAARLLEMGRTRISAGAYEYVVDATKISPGGRHTITKVKGKWYHHSQRSGTSEPFRTLREADEYAKQRIIAEASDPVVGGEFRQGGMNYEEFLDTGEDLWLGDDFVHAWRNKKAGRAKETGRIVNYRATRPTGGNAKSRVYGRTLDLTDGDASKLPEGAQAALRKDHKLRGGRYVGFGKTDLDGRLENTTEWMRRNGYGKLKIGDEYVVLDEFIGGDPTDPLGRVWFADDARPIENVSGFGMADEGVTPAEINGLIDWMASTGRYADEISEVEVAGEGVGRILRAEIAEARRTGRAAPRMEPVPKLDPRGEAIARARGQEGPLRVELEDVRPTVNQGRLTHHLAGKRAQRFAQHLFARSRAAGQNDIGALDRMLRMFDKKGLTVPRSVRSALFEAKSEEEAARIFASWLGHADGPSRVLLPGGTQYGRLSGLQMSQLDRLANEGLKRQLPSRMMTSIREKPWVARRMAAMLPTEPINMLDDTDKAYYMLNEVLGGFGIRRGSGPITAKLEDGTEITTQSLENIFERLRNLAPYQKAEAYDIMGDYAEYLVASLIDQGVDPSLAKAARGWWKDVKGEALFDAERMGRVDLHQGTGDLMLVGDDLVHMGGPQLTSEAWDGLFHFPNRREMRRILGETESFARTLNRATTRIVPSEKLGRATLEERAWYRFADFGMTMIWKPFVLLRGAWTARIFLDDQLRIAAEGLDSIFTHPLRLLGYAQTRPSKWRQNWARGYVDIHGQRIAKDNLSELDYAMDYRSSLMQAPDERIGTGSYGYKAHRRIERGKAGYNEGLVDDHLFLSSSPITKSMASSTADDPIEEATQWLLGKGPASGRSQGAQLRAELADLQRNEEIAQKIRQGDYDTLYNVLSQQYARLHRKTGGKVLLDNGTGQLLDYRTLHATGEQVRETGKARWVVQERGDEDMVNAIGRGEFGGHKLISEEGRAAYRTHVAKRTSRNPEVYPDYVTAARFDNQPREGAKSLREMWDKGVRAFYNIFMTVPSDSMSRSPVFRQAYWRSLADRVPFMDEATERVFWQRARAANMEDQAKGWADAARKVHGERVRGQITDFDTVDRFGKATGLTQVEATLFDLANKKNISESLNLVFPFVEAWGEFLSRWSRLMIFGDRNIRNANRLRQAVNGARSSGFFYENDFGEEVFNYPAFLTREGIRFHNVLNNIPVVGGMMGADVPLEYADQIQSTGRVESLNFAAGVIPGFGPVFQQAAKHILPDDPQWDPIKRIIAPFGMEGGVVTSSAPAYMKRIMSALGGQDDPQLTYTWNSTVQDVLRTMVDQGEFAGATSVAQVNELVAQAEERARGILMVRAAATWWQPSSPSYTWQRQDVHGMVWSFNNLGNHYREIRSEVGGDDIAAFDEFYRRFGFLPTAFTQGRTYQTMPRSITEEGYRFERENKEMFDAYPGTAMFLDPTLGEPQQYDHSVMLKRLDRAEREAWTSEQYVQLMQDQLGDLMWDNANRLTAGINNTQRRNAMLAAARTEIEQLYPMWRQPIAGKRQGITNEQQRQELQRWLTDSRIMGTAIGSAVRDYEDARSQALAAMNALGYKTLSGSTSPEAAAIRAGLRQYAEQLSVEVATFDLLFRNAYADEVSQDHDKIGGYGDQQMDPISQSIFGQNQDNLFYDTLGVDIGS